MIAVAQLAAATGGIDALQARLAQDASDHADRFDLAVCLVNAHDYGGAMGHLFAAREMIFTLSNMLAANAPGQAQVYRWQLTSLLNESCKSVKGV